MTEPTPKIIALAENETSVCDYIEFRLIKEGHDVHKAYTLVEVANILYGLNKVDLLMLDIMMSPMLSTEVDESSAALAALPLFRKIIHEHHRVFPKVILFSANQEMILKAKQHMLVSQVINKNDSTWLQQILDAANK
jgi:CheY-like chemotaxis protein